MSRTPYSIVELDLAQVAEIDTAEVQLLVLGYQITVAVGGALRFMQIGPQRRVGTRAPEARANTRASPKPLSGLRRQSCTQPLFDQPQRKSLDIQQDENQQPSRS